MRALALALCLTGLPGLLAPASAAAQEQRLPPEVSAALARAQVPPQALSVLVTDVATPATPRLAYRADAPVNPASLMKLVTTFAALETLGPAFTWNTPVYVEGAVQHGTLHGNLYIQGRGDPTLVLERLWLLLRRVRGLGIHGIDGDIVLDHGAFAPGSADPGDFDGERLRPYNAVPDALLLNYKSVVMTFVPDRAAQVARVLYEPPLAGVRMQAQVALSGSDCNDYRAALRADFSDPASIRFAGRYPAACGERSWPVAYADPAGYAARAIAGLWREMGGRLRGAVRDGAVPAGLMPAFEISSPPLTEVIRDINKYSNNVMAQQLFLTLSLQQTGQGSFAASRTLLGDWWTQRLGAQDAPLLVNGAGLSRDDRITARALSRLLLHAWASPLMPELAASLPIEGLDGTLKRSRTRAQGSAHLKTGSLRDVAGVAGYVDGAGGRRYVLVAIVNHPNANAARPALQALLEWTQQD